jgi:predicted membrane channel-forming protein YqfA (hemolysin III family)
MVNELRKTYFTCLIPAAAGFLILYTIRTLDLVSWEPMRPPQIIGVSIFILSFFFAIALPIFMRALFAHNMRDRKTIDKAELARFEHYLIALAMVAPYLSLTAYFLELPGFYFSGSFIAALYGVYYYFPSARRIDFEKKIFRVK